MAQKFLSDIHATAGVKDSSGDLGTSGQVLSSTGSLTNWVNPTVGTTVIYKDAFTATNGQTAFTLANTVDSEDKTQVYIDGAYQSKGGYTVSGTTLTFDTGLETSSAVEVITFSTATANNAASAVKLDTFTGDGSDLTFVLSEAVVDEKVTQVYINGVYQNKSTYSIAADLVTLTFGSGNAPPNSSAIEVISFKTITSTDGTLTATTFLGDLNGTINTATTATTQSAGNNSTKISTTAYTDAKVADAINNGTTAIAPSQNAVFDALALKANIAGPTFTGVPAAPTASAGTNTTQLATTAFVTTGIANIVDSAPGTLNTLNELAAALGDDVNFSTTVTDSIATKLPLAGGTLTGDVTFSGDVLIGTNINSDIPLQVNKETAGSGTAIAFLRNTDAAGNGLVVDVTTPQNYVADFRIGNVSKMRITSGGDATFSGNITVGDSHFIGDDSYDNLLIQSSSGENLNLSSANDVIFYTGGTSPSSLGTQRLRIFNSDGDVEISNSVVPTLRLNNTDTSLGSQTLGSIEYYQNDASDQGVGTVSRINCVNESSFAGLGALTFETGTSTSITERLRISSGGDVGIGTSSPNYLLDLQSSETGLTHNLKLNKGSATGDYAEIAFQLWNGAGSGLNTFGGSGTSRPSVVLRAINEASNSAAGAFVVGTFTGGANNSTLTEKFRISSDGTATFKSGNNSFIDLDRNASGNAARIRYKTSGTDEFEAGLIGGIAGYHISDGSANPLLTIASTGALTINASANSTGNPRAIGFGGNSIGTNPLIYYDNAGNLVIDSTNSGKVYLNGDTTGDVNIAQGGGITYVGKTSNGGTQQQLYLAGYPLQSGSSFFGSYGFLTFAATTNYTGSARRYALTNAYAANKFAILQGGSSAANVGLGAGGSALTGTNPVFIIDGLGEISGDFNDTSDISLKKDIESLGDTTELVKKLNPVSFYWNEEQDKGENKNIGFIAQQVEEVVPELVKGDEGGKSINVTGLVSLLTKTVQEQQTIIEDLKARIETLEG